MSGPIRAMVFDFFGVLYLDSHASLAEKYPARAAEIIDLGRQSDYGWLSKSQYLEQLSQVTGESPGSLEAFIDTEHHLNKELIRVIEKLKLQYKIGLLSNVGRGWVSDFLREHDIRQLFDEVVQSGDVGMVKPSREIFEYMAQKLEQETGECLMIDDIADNCAGADAAGMKSILFRSNDQLQVELEELLRQNA